MASYKQPYPTLLAVVTDIYGGIQWQAFDTQMPKLHCVVFVQGNVLVLSHFAPSNEVGRVGSAREHTTVAANNQILTTAEAETDIFGG